MIALAAKGDDKGGHEKYMQNPSSAIIFRAGLHVIGKFNLSLMSNLSLPKSLQAVLVKNGACASGFSH